MDIQRENELTDRNFLKRNLNWLSAYGIYLTLVWAFVIIRFRYMWITGDDPNLFIQAKLTQEGLKPNFDFTSGYPGLSQYVNAGFMKVFGATLITQHIYTAVLASAIGIILAWWLRALPSSIIGSLLVMVYYQEHVVNPTPNPGFLFEILFLIGLHYLLARNSKLKLKDQVIAGFLFGISFLAKQYALAIVPLFVIYQYSLVQINSKWLKNLRKSIITIIGVIFSFGYFITLIPAGESRKLAFSNLLILVLPFLFFILNYNFLIPDTQISTLAAIRNCAGFGFSFISTIAIGLILLYQDTHLGLLIREVLVNAPKRINEDINQISFHKDHLLQSASALIFLAILYSFAVNFKKNKNGFKNLELIQYISIPVAVFLFSQLGNLSSTPFLIFPPLLLTYYLVKHRSTNNLRFGITVFLATYIFILIPYPNINFHITFFVLALGITFEVCGRKVEWKKTSLIQLLLPLALTLALVFHNIQINKALPVYHFKQFTFVSPDFGWKSEIRDAGMAGSNYENCPNLGCKMLILISKNEH